MPPEALLAVALRGDAAPWPLDADPRFETTLLQAAEQHGVSALLTPAPAVRRWPDTLQLALRNARRDQAALEAVRRRLLIRLLEAFEQAGIRCLVIKGAHVAYTHYAQPWLRPRFDTDLLIAPADRERAGAALQALGYVPSIQVSGTLVAHQLQYQRCDRFGLTDTIDLHWKITNPHLFADVLTFDELTTAARTIPQLGGAARGPSNVHALILACVHRVAHHQNSDRLIWLHDIHLLIGAMTPEEGAEFVELARVKRLRSICACGVDLARRRFGTSHPAGWYERLLTSGGEVEPTAAFLDQGLRRVDILVSDLRNVGGWARKIRLIREHLFPPAAYVRARYGRHTPIVFAYVERVATGVGKWFRTPS